MHAKEEAALLVFVRDCRMAVRSKWRAEGCREGSRLAKGLGGALGQEGTAAGRLTGACTLNSDWVEGMGKLQNWAVAKLALLRSNGCGRSAAPGLENCLK